MKFKTIQVMVILCVLTLIGSIMVFTETGEKLSEKDQIITNLRKNLITHKEEIARIKQTRQTQISALVQVLSDCARDMSEKRYEVFRYVNYGDLVANCIELLGELRVAEPEGVDAIINAFCFDVECIITGGGEDSSLWSIRLTKTTEDALCNIGKPAILPLINVIKGTVRRYYLPSLSKLWKEKLKTNGIIAHEIKAGFARKTLYLIEGEFGIYHLEKALKEEPDEKKKENLKEEIKLFREEFLPEDKPKK